MPTSTGGRLLEAYRAGQSLTRAEAIKAKCADCCCGFVDGRFDCLVTSCPLHEFMPYRGRHPKV